ncbi:hypothetical protein E05_35840 [Plautia stali symbiont]|nr:hypothetical protein E05_35840 [Plautia stali symbiont]
MSGYVHTLAVQDNAAVKKGDLLVQLDHRQLQLALAVFYQHHSRYYITIAVPLLVNIDTPNRELLRGADYLSIVLLALSLGCLEYTLEEGPRWGWFDDDTIATTGWIALAAGLICFALSMHFFVPITHDWGAKELLFPQAFRGMAQQFATGTPEARVWPV